MWSKDLKKYDLKDGYVIEKAGWKEFFVYFAVYEVFDANVWFRQSFDIYCSIMKDCNECFWIKKNGCRIGGVLLEPNYMNCLFLEPPYNEYDIIIDKLKSLLLSCSDKSKAIYVGGAKPDKVKYYQRLGFKAGEARRCMIRPTEEFVTIWDSQYKIVSVTKESKIEVNKLFVESFRNTVDKRNLEEQNDSIEFYFDKTPVESRNCLSTGVFNSLYSIFILSHGNL